MVIISPTIIFASNFAAAGLIGSGGLTMLFAGLDGRLRSVPFRAILIVGGCVCIASAILVFAKIFGLV